MSPNLRNAMERIVQLSEIPEGEWTREDEDEIQELRHSIRTDGEAGLHLFNLLGDLSS